MSSPIVVEFMLALAAGESDPSVPSWMHIQDRMAETYRRPPPTVASKNVR